MSVEMMAPERSPPTVTTEQYDVSVIALAMLTVKFPAPLSVILDTLKLARIATVPVPLKFTQARQNVPICVPPELVTAGGDVVLDCSVPTVRVLICDYS